MISKVLLTLPFLMSIFTSPLDGQDIFQIIQEGNSPELIILLQKNPDVVHIHIENQNTPLHYAAVQDNAEIVRILINQGAPVDARNYQGLTPLHQAASNGNINATRILIEAGASVNLKDARGRTPLFLVAMNNGNPDLAKLLIEAGADVNTRETSGSTPLAYAPFRGFSELIDVLLDYGAEVSIEGDIWFEVFHRSCSMGHKRLAEIMIGKGLDINRLNEDGRLPIHSAAEGGSVDLVSLLAERGNPVSSRDYCKSTPLHLAAASGQYPAVEELIKLGSEVNTPNSLGETPFNLAATEGRHEIMRLLVQNGASRNPARFPVIKGPYLGQKTPGNIPEVFGPGLVSAYEPVHGCVTFTTDGNEIYWSIVDVEKRGSTILQMKMRNGFWTKPEAAPFSSGFSDDVPFCSPDGKKLYILSNRPLPGQDNPAKENIWVLERDADLWINAKPVGEAVNSMDLHWQFSVTSDGALYFASGDGSGLGMNDIYRSELVEGEYQEPENLGSAINSSYVDFAPFISPNEKYLIFTSINRPEGSGLYFSRKSEEGNWGKASYLGEPFGDKALLTTLSPDGECLFFTGRISGRKGVFWVSSEVIEGLEH